MKRLLRKEGLILMLGLLTTASLTACTIDNDTPAINANICTTAPVTDNVYDEGWPENEYTRMIPKPDFDLVVEKITEKSFSVFFTDPALSDLATQKAKEYVETLKVNGFTLETETIEEAVIGMTRFSYWAKNIDGWQVQVHSTVFSAGLTISKP